MRAQAATVGVRTRIKGPVNSVARPTLASIASLAASLPGGEALALVLARRLEAAVGEVERERRILEAMLPPVDTLTDAATTQIRLNAVARSEALREFGALTSAGLATVRGAQTRNPHSTTSRWLSDGKVFAVEMPSGRLFPAFQFLEGQPRPVIARVLAALDGQLHGWEVLAWFTGSTGQLGGDRPVDRLDDAPDEVVAAASYQAALSDD